MRMQENTFDVGWTDNLTHRVFGIGRHVSASNLHFECAPTNLHTALAGSNPDRTIWNKAYDKEYDSLRGLDVFTKITDIQYQKYLCKYSDVAKAIPTMNLFTIKNDMDGNPNRANSRIVALGN